MPVMVNGAAIDRILLARIDPARFRFAVRSSPVGDKNLDQWMAQTGAALVMNGSYYGHDGRPDTPVLSDGAALGPAEYDARSGAFVDAPTFTLVRDLRQTDWRQAFEGAHDAMVSYPLLIADGGPRLVTHSDWLANRSFVGQDGAGRVIVGTTADAFFSLDRLAAFLAAAPLDLRIALNLDGGPVAAQGISLNGTERKIVGRWEAQAKDGRVQLLTWPYGTIPMPVVLAVFPR